MTTVWNSALHPRDRFGRWVDVPGIGSDVRVGGRSIEANLRARYDEWGASLTENEFDGINWYQAAGYADINRKLRRGDAMGERQAKYLEGMDAAIAKAPGLESPTFFYRGINDVSRFLGTHDPKQLVGMEFTDHGFSSMSTRDLVAWHARGSGKSKGAALAKIEAPAGLRGAFVPAMYDKWAAGYERGKGVVRPKNALAMDEQEFLPPRGTVFRITKATRAKQGGLNLTMEIVGVEPGTGTAAFAEMDVRSDKFIWEEGDVEIRARAFAWDPSQHPRDRIGRFRGLDLAVAALDHNTMNSLLNEVNKWPRVSPEEGGASPRFYGSKALMDARNGSEVITARDGQGALVGLGTWVDHASGHGVSGKTSGDFIEGGTFAALGGAGLALFKGFLELAAERNAGVTFTAGNARAEKLYDRLGVPKVAKGSKKGEGAVYEMTAEEVKARLGDLFVRAHVTPSAPPKPKPVSIAHLFNKDPYAAGLERNRRSMGITGAREQYLGYAWEERLHPRDPAGRFRTLIELDPPGKYVYHVTDEENLDAIRREGLTPHTTSMVNEADYPGVYAWTDPKAARMWQREGQVVLKVPRDAVQWEPDEMGTALDKPGEALRSRLAIAPELIEVEDAPGGRYAQSLVELLTDPDINKFPIEDFLADPAAAVEKAIPSLLEEPRYRARFANPDVLEAARRLLMHLRARAYEFDPHQPRDRHGRWTKTGSRVIAPWKEIIGKKLSFSASEVTMDNLTEDEQARIRDTWTRQTGVPAAKVAVNIRDVFRSAEGTPQWEAGLTWYEDAHEFARQRAETHDLSIETTAGVISALSPMTEWNTNKHQADLIMQYRSLNPEHFDSLLPQQAAHETLAWAKERGEKWPLGAGRRNIVNAARLLQGATPEEVLPQAKTRGFYNSIVEPNNPWDVVIDSHMLNVAYGGMTPGAAGLLIEVSKPGSADVWGDVVTPEGADYTARPPFSWFGSPKVRGRDVGVIPLLADGVRAAAAEWNQEHPDQPLSPMQVQAITWVQWLHLHPAQEKRKAVKESQRATVAALRLATV